jgi:hypothetical protein
MRMGYINERSAPLTKAGIPLAGMLAAGAINYEFNALLSLKAIFYPEDRTLAEQPKDVRHDLIDAVRVGTGFQPQD